MADLSSITAVRPTSNTIFRSVVYGATVAAGQTVYLDSTDSEHKLADADASEASSVTAGIAMTPGVDGGYGIIATGGSIILVGTTMTVGETYLQSDTAGGIMPVTDKDSGDYVTILGVAATSTQLDLAIRASRVQVP